ncbi:MAG: pitrilysin family protein [Gemmatimonadota bacterium]|nr:pitrilysin family protein [Gemmatimonadota bacterium]
MNRRDLIGLAIFACVAVLTAADATAQVTTPPAMTPAPSLTLPTTWRATLPNGVTIVGADMREVPLVRATLSIAGGGRLDGDRPGIASMTADLLDEGAGGRDAIGLAEDVAFLGASLGTGAGWDAITLSLTAPRRTFDDAMTILARVALQPTFARADVQRQQDLRLASIIQQRDQPAAVASQVFNREVFGRGHPYHAQLGGDSTSIAGLDSTALRTFWNRAADPRRATLIITGAITQREAVALATRLLGDWRAPANALAITPAGAIPAPNRGTTRVVLVDKPGAAQSVINIGAPGVDRSSPDYAAILLMNTILGGSFSARLNDILREQKGFSYGANSGYSWRPVPGPFLASSAVRTDVTDSSLAIFFEQFKRIRDEVVLADELERARSYSVLGALGNYETTGQVAGQLATALSFGMTLEQVPAELAAIQKLTAADVQRAARQHLDPARLTVVVVGDLSKIRAGIEALRLGPVTIVTP